MAELLRIAAKEYAKTAGGVFEVPLGDLGPLRFADVPFYSTVELTDLPGTPNSYRLSVSATHGGGPHNEDFTLFLHVSFRQRGEAHDTSARAACDRKLARIRRNFYTFVEGGIVTDGDGDEHRTRWDGEWLCQILYSRSFSREENPQLAEFIDPFVKRFARLLALPDLLVFLCHASEDKEFVDELASYLDTRELSLWYDKREIRIGDSIVERVGEGLTTATHLVVVLSSASVAKPWVQKELSSALMSQLKDRSIVVAPVLRETCPLPALLRDIRYADCRFDKTAGFRDLVDGILGLAHGSG